MSKIKNSGLDLDGAVMLTRPQASRPRPRPQKARPRPIKTKTKTEEAKTKTKTKVGKTYTKTNVIAADNVIINGKVAIIVSFYSTIFCMFSLFFHHNFLCIVYI